MGEAYVCQHRLELFGQRLQAILRQHSGDVQHSAGHFLVVLKVLVVCLQPSLQHRTDPVNVSACRAEVVTHFLRMRSMVSLRNALSASSASVGKLTFTLSFNMSSSPEMSVNDGK